MRESRGGRCSAGSESAASVPRSGPSAPTRGRTGRRPGGRTRGAGTVAFHGEHQGGIATEAQDRLAFASFDVVTTDRGELRDLLREWTAAAAAMTRGQPVPGDSSRTEAPPADTGETEGLAPGLLTVTVGFGPSLFDDRFGLAPRRPAAAARRCRPCPATAWTPAAPAATSHPGLRGRPAGRLPRHPQPGPHRPGRRCRCAGPSSASAARPPRPSTQSTPRNLMGFKDGTRNVRGDDTARMREHVWVPAGSDQAWMTGGSYLVARRIRMRIEGWDRDPLADQESVFGRDKVEGAPLTGTRETDVPDYAARRADGTPVIPMDAHIRLAAPRTTTAGRCCAAATPSPTASTRPPASSTPACSSSPFMRDPQVFVHLQNRLGTLDALNEYIEHVGSGLFACPGGVRGPGDHWGRAPVRLTRPVRDQTGRPSATK